MRRSSVCFCVHFCAYARLARACVAGGNVQGPVCALHRCAARWSTVPTTAAPLPNFQAQARRFSWHKAQRRMHGGKGAWPRRSTQLGKVGGGGGGGGVSTAGNTGPGAKCVLVSAVQCARCVFVSPPVLCLCVRPVNLMAPKAAVAHSRGHDRLDVDQSGACTPRRPTHA
jgi:hypothetical protein